MNKTLVEIVSAASECNMNTECTGVLALCHDNQSA